MKVKSQSEIAQLCPTLSDPMDCSLPVDGRFLHSQGPSPGGLACAGASVGDSLPCSGLVRALCLQAPLELHREERAQLGASEVLPKHIETQETWLWEHQQVPGQVDFGMNGRQYGTVGSSKVKAWSL